jgi:hypothetical protein
VAAGWAGDEGRHEGDAVEWDTQRRLVHADPWRVKGLDDKEDNVYNLELNLQAQYCVGSTDCQTTPDALPGKNLLVRQNLAAFFISGDAMNHKAYSLLTIKSVDEQRRIIRGIASTPTADRMEDIVEPMGARFKVPMPLLLYHNSQKPVGSMDFAKPTKEGIPFEASLPNVVEPGVVQDRVNEAFHSLKYKLIGAVSIGFQPLKDGVELLKSGGLRFMQWEWLELSLVTIPANPEAVIQSFKSADAAQIQRSLGLNPSDEARQALIKSIDLALLAASGNRPRQVVHLKNSPGVSGKPPARRAGVVYLKP